MLDLGRVEVDAADDQHVVAAAADGAHARERAPAGARLVGQRRDVAGAVAQQRQRLLGQRREDELAVDAVGDRLAGLGSMTSTRKWSSLTCRPSRGLAALGRDARADDLREPVDVDAPRSPSSASSCARIASVHGSAPNRPTSSASVVGADARLAQRLGDVQRVGRRRSTAPGACRSRSSVRLARGDAAGDRDDRRAEPLGALVEAEPAGEQPVAVGVVDDHARPHAGHRHAARHHLGPDVEVVAACRRRRSACRPCRWRRGCARARSRGTASSPNG